MGLWGMTMHGSPRTVQAGPNRQKITYLLEFSWPVEFKDIFNVYVLLVKQLFHTFLLNTSGEDFNCYLYSLFSILPLLIFFWGWVKPLPFRCRVPQHHSPVSFHLLALLHHCHQHLDSRGFHLSPIFMDPWLLEMHHIDGVLILPQLSSDMHLNLTSPHSNSSTSGEKSCSHPSDSVMVVIQKCLPQGCQG